VAKRWKRQRELDQEFYKRFEDELSRYSKFDLCTNAVELVLEKVPPSPSKAPPKSPQPKSALDRAKDKARGLRSAVMKKLK
jgi:hypothetical protein